MVKIDKKLVPTPALLTNHGVNVTKNLTAQYDAGIRDFSFSRKIYGNKEIKSALEKAQHYKCCYCESKFRHVSHGDVEHYRPKKGWQSTPNDRLTRPGYYWLAYDFSNLFYSCEICNRSFKRNYFPLVDETRRAISHHYELGGEQPLVIDPSVEEPSEHISFNREVPIPLNEKGEATIKRTGLDRKALNDERLEYYEFVALAAKMARNGDSEALQKIRRASLPTERYSLMVRCNFPDLLD